MSQLVITHADGSTSSYPLTDSSVLIIDGQSVALSGVAAVSLSDAPVEAAPIAVEEPQQAPPVIQPAPAVEAAPPARRPGGGPPAGDPGGPSPAGRRAGHLAAMKKTLVALYSNRLIRKDAYDIVKVAVGVVAAKYGLKLA